MPEVYVARTYVRCLMIALIVDCRRRVEIRTGVFKKQQEAELSGMSSQTDKKYSVTTDDKRQAIVTCITYGYC